MKLISAGKCRPGCSLTWSEYIMIKLRKKSIACHPISFLRILVKRNSASNKHMTNTIGDLITRQCTNFNDGLVNAWMDKYMYTPQWMWWFIYALISINPFCKRCLLWYLPGTSCSNMAYLRLRLGKLTAFIASRGLQITLTYLVHKPHSSEITGLNGNIVTNQPQPPIYAHGCVVLWLLRLVLVNMS